MRNFKKLLSFVLSLVVMAGLVTPINVAFATETDQGTIDYSQLCDLEQPTFELLSEEEVASDSAFMYNPVQEQYIKEGVNWDKYAGNDSFHKSQSGIIREMYDAFEAAAEAYAYSGSTDNRIGVVVDSDLNYKELWNIAYEFKLEHPEYFFLSNKMSAGYSSEGMVIYLYVYNDFCDPYARVNTINEFYAKIDKWIDIVNQYGREGDKAKIINDIVCSNTTYQPVYSSQNERLDQSAYSLVCLGRTVCAGYAATTSILCNAAGIDSIVVTSSNHAWNKVKVHGNWYALDTTWNDNKNVNYYYSYFLVSDESLINGVGGNNESHYPESRWMKYVIEAATNDSNFSYLYQTAYVNDDNFVYFIANRNPDRGERKAIIVDVLKSGSIPESIIVSGDTYKVALEPSAQRKQDIKRFVERMYTVVMNRESDEEGMNFWTNKLINQTIDGATVASFFFFSDEFKELKLDNDEFLNRLYKTCFDRESDEGGYNFWMNFLNNGVTREFIVKQFIESPEFTQICSNFGITRGNVVLERYVDKSPAVTMYIFRCYNRVLGRTPDEDGIEYWAKKLFNHEMSAKDIAMYFAFCDEYVLKKTSDAEYVTMLYNMFFDREPEEEGFEFWKNSLVNGKSRQDVLDFFAGSPEFAEILAQFGI